MEKDKKKSKSTGQVVHATIPKEQYRIIEALDGTLGVGTNGVVANIINSWLEQQEWYKEIIKKKVGQHENKD
jgi:hypothetical protein